jgi:uncharacterized protein with ATP-grasp and redox domains
MGPMHIQTECRPCLNKLVDLTVKLATVGLLLEEVSPSFCRLLDRADLILAKGMGHFETLSHHKDSRIFFLLQAKCGPVAAALQVPVGSFVVRSLSAHV